MSLKPGDVHPCMTDCQLSMTLFNLQNNAPSCADTCAMVRTSLYAPSSGCASTCDNDVKICLEWTGCASSGEGCEDAVELFEESSEIIIEDSSESTGSSSSSTIDPCFSCCPVGVCDSPADAYKPQCAGCSVCRQTGTCPAGILEVPRELLAAMLSAGHGMGKAPVTMCQMCCHECNNGDGSGQCSGQKKWDKTTDNCADRESSKCKSLVDDLEDDDIRCESILLEHMHAIEWSPLNKYRSERTGEDAMDGLVNACDVCPQSCLDIQGSCKNQCNYKPELIRAATAGETAAMFFGCGIVGGLLFNHFAGQEREAGM